MKILSIITTVLIFASGSSYEAIWRKVVVSDKRLKTRGLYQENITANYLHQCFVACYLLEWCLLTCWDQSEGICFLTNVIVSGNYKETKTTMKMLPCYTKRVTNLLVGKSIEVDSVSADFPDRVPELLIDGFYSYLISECFKSGVSDGILNWIKIDLKQILYISEITLICQMNLFVIKMCKDFTFKVGLDPNPETMKVFGYFVGPGTKNQSVTISQYPPICGRFIYIEKPQDSTSFLQICHLEVYGKKH